MEEENKLSLREECQRIIDNAPKGQNSDLMMRYICHELALLLSKNVEFFYENDNTTRRNEIYENYQNIENNEVICRNAAYIHVELAKHLGLDCKMIEIKNENPEKVNHWAIEYKSEDNKRYLINPVPDFYRIQMGFSTKSFCNTSEYLGYEGEKFDIMSKEYLRSLDKELGYLPGDMYTEELLEKLHTEINFKIGSHIVKTTDTYQEIYLKLIELANNDTLTIQEKLNQMKSLDNEYYKHHFVLKEYFETKKMTKDTKKIINNIAIKTLSGKDNLERVKEGSKYTGKFDIRNPKKIKKELLIYKFNYMMECIPQLTKQLTGFIENKNFMDEVQKYIFKKDEQNKIHRHTVSRIENGKKEYYMMFSLNILDNRNEKIYCFYNPKTKECLRGIEPLEFMLKNNLSPRKDSSLDRELTKRKDLDSMFCDTDSLDKENITKASTM